MACRNIIARLNESEVGLLAIIDYWTFDGNLTFWLLQQATS